MEPPLPKKLRSGDIPFDFNRHCFLCPNITECILPDEYDARIPKRRRRPAYSVRRVKEKNGTEYKKKLLELCDKRGDKLGSLVRDRILSAVGDLHAADARYHGDCEKNFDTYPKSVL